MSQASIRGEKDMFSECLLLLAKDITILAVLIKKLGKGTFSRETWVGVATVK